LKKQRKEPLVVFSTYDSNHDGFLSFSELQRLLEQLNLGFSSNDICEVVRLCDTDEDGKISLDDFASSLELNLDSGDMDEENQNANQTKTRWMCSNCTYMNWPDDSICVMCNYGWEGNLRPPADKWLCDPTKGGCSFFNDKTTYYCDMCNRSRPDLATTKF